MSERRWWEPGWMPEYAVSLPTPERMAQLDAMIEKRRLNHKRNNARAQQRRRGEIG